MANLTFLLPLQDRPEYTEIWVKHNIRAEYNYIVADGSLEDANELIFSEINLPNLKYVRFPKDLTIECYIKKMVSASELIKTEYVMTCDNDDFINFVGVDKCLKALELNQDVTCASGAYYCVMQNVNEGSGGSYCLPLKVFDLKQFDDLKGFGAIRSLFSQYRYLWYSIYNLDVFKSIWRDIESLQISNIFLIEMAQAQLTFCYGSYLHVNCNHYLRLANPIGSSAQEASKGQEKHTTKIYFDEEYRRKVIRMSEHVANILGIDLSELLLVLKNYYINSISSKKSWFRTKILDRLIRLHVIIPKKLNIYFSIETGMRMINALEKKQERTGRSE